MGRWLRPFAALVLVWWSCAGGATQITMTGTPAFVPSGASVMLKVPHLENRSALPSRRLRLELWAFSYPFDGYAGLGYQLAQASIGTLGGYASLDHLNVGPVAYALPPWRGPWHFSLIVTEVDSAGKYWAVAYWNFADRMACQDGICAPVEPATLTVSTLGQGLVTSTPGGIACPGDCSETMDEYSDVVLYAHPAPGYRFSGWSGACPASGDCSVTLVGTRTVTASFSPSHEAAVCPTPGLWVIDAEQNGEPGRGFAVEEQGGTLVVTVFGYEPSGAATFHQAAGTAGSNAFIGDLEFFSGGAAFGQPPTPATRAGRAGPVALAFTDPEHGTVTLPGERRKPVSKFKWGGATADSASPAAGLWVVDEEQNGQPGRGFTLEDQGGTMVLTAYAYDTSGKARFYQAVGPVRDGAFTAALSRYRDGTAFGSFTRAATLAETAGPVTVRFTGRDRGDITFPGEASKAIRKFTWGTPCLPGSR